MMSMMSTPPPILSSPCTNDTPAYHSGMRQRAQAHTLKRLRRAAGLTQAQVAAAVGVDRVAVARWEAGVTAARAAHYEAAVAFIRAQARRPAGELARLANRTTP